MPDYKEIKLYQGGVTILFDEKNHAYWLQEEKKRRLAGVTTFINILDKPALIPWSVGVTIDYIKTHMDRLHDDPNILLREAKAEADRRKQEAADIGTAIHKWVEEYAKGQNPQMPSDDAVLLGVNSFLEWVEKNNVKFVKSEKVVYSKKYGYVGTLDMLVEIDGKLYLVDIKTGNALYVEVRLQTSAYMKAEIEENKQPIAGRWALRISKETETQYIERMEQKGKTDYPEYKVFEAVYLDEDEHDCDRDFDTFLSVYNIYQWRKRAKL